MAEKEWMKCVAVGNEIVFSGIGAVCSIICCSGQSVRMMWRSELARFTLGRHRHAPSPGMNLRAGSGGP